MARNLTAADAPTETKCCATCYFWQRRQPGINRPDPYGWCRHHETRTWASGDCGDHDNRKFYRSAK